MNTDNANETVIGGVGRSARKNVFSWFGLDLFLLFQLLP